MKSAHSNLSKCKYFWKKIKILKSETKNNLFGNLQTKTRKEYCHIWNKHPRFCGNAKQKKIQIWHELCLISVFLNLNLKLLLSLLKSAPSNLSKWKFLYKTKKNQACNQSFFIWVALGYDFEKLLTYLKSAPSNLSKKSF